VTNSQREYREHLLCKDCESKFNTYETYVSNVLYNFKKFFNQEGDVVTVYNVDYKKFKLFQLSMLWRCSVTSIPVFENGKIPEKHEDIIRKMLIDENPGEEFEYSCRLFGLLLRNKLETQFMMNPGFMNVNNLLIVYHTFGGFRWHFVVDNEQTDIPESTYSLKKSNELIYKLIDMTEIPDINDIMFKHVK
jgi:hypothetical protein